MTNQPLTASEIRNRVKEVQKVRFGAIMNHPRNPRKHGDNQRQAFRGSVRELGFVSVPMAYYSDRYSEKGIKQLVWADGHLRGSETAEYTGDVAILDIDDAEADKLLLYADPIAAMAEYESHQLSGLLAEINTGDAALQAMLAGLATEAGLYPDKPTVKDVEPQIDKAEELRQKWDTAEGDIWSIGDHFVICGDCREPDTWHRLLNVAGVDKVNGVFTSPPYAEQRKAQYGGVPADEYVDWWEALQANVRGNLAKDGSFFVNIKPHCEDGQRVLYVMDMVCAMVRRWGWKFIDELCWTHQGIPGDYRGRFKNQFEAIYHFSQGKHKHLPGDVSHKTKHTGPTYAQNPHIKTKTKSPFEQGTKMAYDGMARPGNVIECAIGDATGHAAAFPVALPDFFIRAYSDPGDNWIDPFLGSGTTIVAAHQNKRRGLGIEMLPKYLGVILERLVTVVGVHPVRVEA